MNITVATIILIIHSYLFWRWRYFAFSIKTRQKIFYIYGSLIFAQQMWFVGIQIYNQNWYHLQYTDLCLMTLQFVWISCLFNLPRVQRMIAPWALIGAMFTCFGSDFGWNLSMEKYTTALLQHWLMLSFSLTTLMMHSFNRKDLYNSFYYAIIYGFYIYILCSLLVWITGNKQHTFYSTMMFPLTYTDPESGYSFVNGLLPYPWPTIIFYCLGFLLDFLAWYLVHRYSSIFKKKNFKKSIPLSIIAKNKFSK